MTGHRFEREERPHSRDRFAAWGRDLPSPFVLIASRSEITRVVVGRILERAGFRPVSMRPDQAMPLLADARLGLAILDGGAGQDECEGLLARLEATRGARRSVRVLFLSNRTGTPASLGLPAVVDAVVAKPITPERLQPAVEAILGRAR